MNILDVCNDLSILGVILFIKNLLKIICVAVPILLLLFLTIDFTKATIESDSEKMNKVKAIAIKRIMYAIIVFLVPVIVNGVMSLLGDSTNFSSCYDMANNDNVQSLAEANKLEQDAKKAKTEQAKKELDEKVKKIYAQIRENRKKQGMAAQQKVTILMFLLLNIKKQAVSQKQQLVKEDLETIKQVIKLVQKSGLVVSVGVDGFY